MGSLGGGKSLRTWQWWDRRKLPGQWSLSRQYPVKSMMGEALYAVDGG